MMRSYKKASTKVIAVGTICLVILTGCASLSTSDSNENTQNVTETENSSEDTSVDTETISFESYLNLLELNKKELLEQIEEKPEAIDEGGLEWKEMGIRVWFDMDSQKVSQIFIQNDDVDFNGARIGDSIEDFKTIFGEPVSDQNGDMHVKYQNKYLSITYDTKTDTTVAVYLLNEDF